MNASDEQRWETVIDRELKALPLRRAPATLAPRVLAALARRTARPWYRQPWQTWPLPLRATSLLLLGAAFAGVCYAGWQLPRLTALASAARTLGGWLGALEVLGKAAAVLLNAGGHVLQSCGTATLVGAATVLLLSYALGVGLTTIYLRLALARR